MTSTYQIHISLLARCCVPSALCYHSVRLASYIVHCTSCIVHPASSILHCTSSILHPPSCILHPLHSTRSILSPPKVVTLVVKYQLLVVAYRELFQVDSYRSVPST